MKPGNRSTRNTINKKYQDKKRRVKEADIKVGDIVICKQGKLNKSTRLFSPERFIVVKRRGTTAYAMNVQRTFYKRTRNISLFQKIRKEEYDEFEPEPIMEERPNEPKRSKRQRNDAERYGHVLQIRNN